MKRRLKKLMNRKKLNASDQWEKTYKMYSESIDLTPVSARVSV